MSIHPATRAVISKVKEKRKHKGVVIHGNVCTSSKKLMTQPFGLLYSGMSLHVTK